MNRMLSTLGSVLVKSAWILMYLVLGLSFWRRFSGEREFLGQVILAMLILQCLTTAIVLFVRDRAKKTSWRPYDIVVTAAGTFAPFFFVRGNSSEAHWLSAAVQIAGYMLSIAALAFLRRSMGALPANRGIRTGGPSALIRHPLYAGYLISLAGFVSHHINAHNCIVFGAAVTGECLRLLSEERLLSGDPAYLAYRQKVRWRLIPFIF